MALLHGPRFPRSASSEISPPFPRRSWGICRAAGKVDRYQPLSLLTKLNHSTRDHVDGAAAFLSQVFWAFPRCPHPEFSPCHKNPGEHPSVIALRWFSPGLPLCNLTGPQASYLCPLSKLTNHLCFYGPQSGREGRPKKHMGRSPFLPIVCWTPRTIRGGELRRQPKIIAFFPVFLSVDPLCKLL